MKRVNLSVAALAAVGLLMAASASACETPRPIVCAPGTVQDHGICQPKPENPVCGNGKVERGEACDDGNRNDADACTNRCEKPIVIDPVCGNGKVERNETCDDGNTNDNDSCTNKCEKQIVKEVPVETVVTKEVPVITTVTNTVEKVVYKYKHHHDKDHDKKDKKKSSVKDVLPATGLPAVAVAGVALSAAGVSVASRKLRRK